MLGRQLVKKARVREDGHQIKRIEGFPAKRRALNRKENTKSSSLENRPKEGNAHMMEWYGKAWPVVSQEKPPWGGPHTHPEDRKGTGGTGNGRPPKRRRTVTRPPAFWGQSRHLNHETRRSCVDQEGENTCTLSFSAALFTPRNLHKASLF